MTVENRGISWRYAEGESAKENTTIVTQMTDGLAHQGNDVAFGTCIDDMYNHSWTDKVGS